MGNFRGWEYIILLLLALPFIIAGVAIIIAIQRRGRTTALSAPAAGWLPDPTDATLLRYWDGAQWTGQTAKRE